MSGEIPRCHLALRNREGTEWWGPWSPRRKGFSLPTVSLVFLPVIRSKDSVVRSVCLNHSKCGESSSCHFGPGALVVCVSSSK